MSRPLVSDYDIEEEVKTEKKKNIEDLKAKNGVLMFYISLVLLLVVLFVTGLLFGKIAGEKKQLENELSRVVSFNEFYNQPVDITILFDIEFYSRTYNVDKYLVESIIKSDYKFKVKEIQIKKVASVLQTLFIKYKFDEVVSVYYGNDIERIERTLKEYRILTKEK